MSYSKGFGKPPAAPVEYIFGEGNTPFTYTVSKWDGGEQPREVYEVLVNADGKQLSCNCPAFAKKLTQPCKHYQMLGEWLEADKPSQEEYSCLGRGKTWVFKLHREL